MFNSSYLAIKNWQGRLDSNQRLKGQNLACFPLTLQPQWQSHPDLNWNKIIQSDSCYRYIMGQYEIKSKLRDELPRCLAVEGALMLHDVG